MKSTTIDSTLIEVQDLGYNDPNNGPVFRWSVSNLPSGESFSKDDLKAGIFGVPDEGKMLETFLDFLASAGESYRHAGMDGENSDLFPEPLTQWAAEYLTEIESMRWTLEFDREQAEAMREVAYDWHGGQWSPLYAFASSGIVEDGEDLVREIELNIKKEPLGATELADNEQLEQLRDFVRSLPNHGDGTWSAPWRDA
jgi:hypothetical protein